MSAPIGNKNALGNRGGGRKSAFDEIKEAEWLTDAWSCDQDVEALRNKIEVDQVYSVKDMLLWKALKGNVTALRRFADAILPSRIESLENSNQPTSEEVEKKVQLLLKAERAANRCALAGSTSEK